MNKTGQLFQELVDATPTDIKKRIDWSFQIADLIAETLKVQGMSQKDFAHKIGHSTAEVCRWVGGTHNFTLATLAKISDTLGVDLISVEKKESREGRKEGTN